MNEQENESLKKRIINEMTVSYATTLERYFNVAKRFIRLTRDGRVNILNKDNLSGEEQILLYLIGKLYTKEAGFIKTEEVGNKEIMKELGMPRGSLLPFLKRLRDKNKIEAIKRGRYTYHRIPINIVGETLESIKTKTGDLGEI